MTRSKDFYLRLLGLLLVEIRALDDESRVQLKAALGDDKEKTTALGLAKALAHVFHNVPAALQQEWTAELDAETHEHLIATAEVFGLREVIERWEVWALGRAVPLLR